MSAFESLHPSLQYHIVNSLGWSTLRPTQLEAIEPIQRGEHCLLLAPTAGGKTEAAIIPVLSRMLLESWPATSVLYVCPIKALLNNLEERLSRYAGLVGRRVGVWHGDVSQSRKQKALKDAPDILLTTPESLEGMLISTKVMRKAWFGQLRTVIVDELHAFAADDRGWHLRSVVSRLERYAEQPVQRIGLSATVSNPDQLLHWFTPHAEGRVVGTASVSTDADVTIDHVGSLQNAGLVISRLHRGEKRLVFCDSRSSAEKLASDLRAREVRTFVSHASLSASERKQAETAFAEEKSCVIVATSTLELGIDVGDLDRVIQIDAPATVSSFLQRMGRTGRRVGARRNCLLLTTTDDAFLLALGITAKWSQAWVEATVPPTEPWHIVAQQALVTMLENAELPAHDLLSALQRAFPELAAEDVAALLRHLIQTEFLIETNSVVAVGPATEREFGRGHYMDLLASFTGANLLTARHGSAEIGYIDPSVLVGDDAERRLILAGRSWRVTAIEWPRKTVWLEPATEGGTARWLGGARSLGREVSQAIALACANGPPEVVELSKRAKTKVEELRTWVPASDRLTISAGAAGKRRLWTFAGTRQNRSLAHALAAQVHVSKFDALGIDFAGDAELDLSPIDADSITPTSAEMESLAKTLKFADCLPNDLLVRVVRSRNFETYQPARTAR